MLFWKPLMRRAKTTERGEIAINWFHKGNFPGGEGPRKTENLARGIKNMHKPN